MSVFPDSVVGANRTLYHLIRASGYSGASGQSFRNNVAGSPTTGTKMSDYKTNSWDATGLPDSSTTYTSGHVFNLALTFTEGVQAANIRRTGSVVTVTSDVGFGGSVSTSSSIVGSSTGSTCDLTIVSQFRADSIINVTGAYFIGYGDRDHQTVMPGDTLTHDIAYFVDTSASGTAADHNVTANLSYTVDSGGFNGFFSTNVVASMHDRVATISDFDSIQWSWDGGSTIESGTGATSPNKAEGAVGDTTTVWYRARLLGGSYGSWTAISFDDTRDPI